MVLIAVVQSLPPFAATLQRETFPSAAPTCGNPPAWKVPETSLPADLESGLFGPSWRLCWTSRWKPPDLLLEADIDRGSRCIALRLAEFGIGWFGRQLRGDGFRCCSGPPEASE